jgi:hypothetical protein
VGCNPDLRTNKYWGYASSCKSPVPCVWTMLLASGGSHAFPACSEVQRLLSRHLAPAEQWGNGPLNFACSACMQAFEYTAEDCHWGPIEQLQMERTALPIVHQLTVPCGIEKCAGLIFIHFVAPQELPRSEGPALALRLVARGVKCEQWHVNDGSSIGAGSLSLYPLSGF